MSFHFRLPWSKPEPAPVRYVVAHREENRRARIARIHTELQLGVAVAQLTPEQKREAIERASRPSTSQDRGRG